MSNPLLSVYLCSNWLSYNIFLSLDFDPPPWNIVNTCQTLIIIASPIIVTHYTSCLGFCILLSCLQLLWQSKEQLKAPSSVERGNFRILPKFQASSWLHLCHSEGRAQEDQEFGCMKPAPTDTGREHLRPFSGSNPLTNPVMNQSMFVAFSGHVLLQLVGLSDQSLD